MTDKRTPWQIVRDTTIDRIEKITAILAGQVEGFVVAKTYITAVAVKRDGDTYLLDVVGTGPEIFGDRAAAERLARYWNGNLAGEQRVTFQVEVLPLRKFLERALAEAQQLMTFIHKNSKAA